MKTIINLIFFFPVSFSVIQEDYSQQIIKEPYLILWRVNDNILFELDRKKKRLYWNNTNIDSTGLKFSHKFEQRLIFNKDLLIGYQWKEEDGKHFYSIDLNGRVKHLNKIQEAIFYRTSKNFFFTKKLSLEINDDRITHFYDRGFYKFNIDTATPSTYFNMNKSTGIDSLDGSDLCNLYELPNNNLVATLCFCDGGCTDFKYYLIDTLTGMVHKINLNNKEPNNEFYQVKFIISDQQFNLVEINHHSIKRENAGFFIYDSSFKEISRALEHNERSIGANYKDGKYLSDNVKTILDDGQSVIITYKFSMPLERSLYQIYANLPLFSEDLAMCTNHELDLLKNMVFAKHNYMFQTEYYQAYFNFYEFYDSEEKRKTRTKEVNHLLTSTDKKNLMLINDKLKK